MNRLTTYALSLGICASVLAGCSTTADVDSADTPAGSSDEVFHWIREGVRQATETLDERAAAAAAERRARTAPLFATEDGTLPSRTIVVPALVTQGLSEEQAGCVYDAIAASPDVTADVSSLLNGIADLAVPGAPGDPTAPAGLDTATANRLLVTVVPCLDETALLTLLGNGGQPTGEGVSLAALLSTPGGSSLAGLGDADIDRLATAIAGSLGPAQVGFARDLIRAAGRGQTEQAAAALTRLDVKRLTLTGLDTGQLQLMALSILQGLTGPQRDQLGALTRLRLDQTDLNLNPDELSPDQVAGLLAVLAPLLGGQSAPDLSNINPLLFINRTALLQQFEAQGIDRTTSSCVFDNMATMDRQTLTALFGATGTAAVSSLLQLAVSCLTDGN